MPVARRFVAIAIPALVAVIASAARAQCPVERVLAERTVAGDQLGDAVAISGDVGVVGASRHDFLGSASGAAFVFRYGPDAGGQPRWNEEARLLADDGGPNDLFGAAVAIDTLATPGETIVVGAGLADNARGNDAGAAYVFESYVNGGEWAWALVQTLPVPQGAADDRFGHAVAVRGDLIAVGAPRHDGTALNAGAVYVYRYGGSLWSYETTLEIQGAADHDLMGVAVAVDGATILVGAAFRDDAGTNSGAAYAFRHDGATWDAGELIVADDGAAQDKFGEAVALRGDIALVGAALDDDGGANAGSVYVFRFDGIWSQTAKLTASDFGADARFGTSVALSDGVEGGLALVGAPAARAGGVASGAAYLYAFDGVDWIETAKLVGLEAAAGDQFGWSTGLGDRFLLAGANMDDDGAAGPNAGSVNVFTTGLETLADCNGNGESDFCDLASGVSLDCNANGVPDECDVDPGDPDGNGETSEDVNGDGVPDECEDCNGNGVPDFEEIAGDPDLDCNGNMTIDACEIPVEDGGFCTEDCLPDCDGNGRPDGCDIDEGVADCNTNGVPDPCDIADGTSQDADGDGVPDECSGDCNGNGRADSVDIETGTSEDCNGNGIPDECDVDPDDPDGNGETSLDLNGDGVPDECQDCNGNRIPDFYEIAADPGLDCNDNDIIDACEIPTGHGEPGEYFCTADCDPDCNVNGIPDACDIADATSEDVNANGIPDECEDCNANGVLDSVDITSGTSPDCNGNGTPDECEIPAGHGEPGEFFCTEDCDPDCNANGVPDACDIEAGTVEDCDANGVPDSCDPDCDANGIPDACDLLEPNRDLNQNGILDVCEADCNDNGLPDFLEILLGLVDDDNGNGIPDECETCPGDATFDGVVDFEDVLYLLLHYGPCPPPCPGDFDADGAIGFTDVLATLAGWGSCP